MNILCHFTLLLFFFFFLFKQQLENLLSGSDYAVAENNVIHPESLDVHELNNVQLPNHQDAVVAPSGEPSPELVAEPVPVVQAVHSPEVNVPAVVPGPAESVAEPAQPATLVTSTDAQKNAVPSKKPCAGAQAAATKKSSSKLLAGTLIAKAVSSRLAAAKAAVGAKSSDNGATAGVHVSKNAAMAPPADKPTKSATLTAGAAGIAKKPSPAVASGHAAKPVAAPRSKTLAAGPAKNRPATTGTNGVASGVVKFSPAEVKKPKPVAGEYCICRYTEKGQMQRRYRNTVKPRYNVPRFNVFSLHHVEKNFALPIAAHVFHPRYNVNFNVTLKNFGPQRNVP